MKLEYNILWIDNDIQEYIDNGEVDNLNSFLEELGFEPNIVTVKDEADLDQFIYNHKYDLIISDFNLNATTGDKIIEKIRDEKGFSTEILFYTAKSNFRDDPEVKERLAFMDRITFHSNRDTFLDKVEKLIRLTLDKLLELNATRGLITAATSDLDVEIEEIYYTIISRAVDDELKPKVEKIFKTDYKEIKKSLLKRCKGQRDSHSADYRMYFSQSDAFRKWDLLKELISLNVPDGFDLVLFKEYYKEVIKIRNQFAHAKAIEDNGKLKLKGQIEGEDFEFTEDSCVEIRRNLINHKRNIETLKNILKNS
jgi:CheY-like chemotaxis protein